MVRRQVVNRPPKEEGLNDPLANVEQFNIIQFLQAEGDFNGPMESFDEMNIEQKIEPLLHQTMQQQMIEPRMLQQLQQQQLQQQQLQQQMYQQQLVGMPMTPAITDLTRHGSSSSPSTTNSDPPYSPEGMEFGLGTQRLNTGIIPNHEVRGHSQMMNTPFDQRMAQQQQHQQPSNSQSFNQFLNANHSTPASYVQSISPDSQNEGQGFSQSNLYNALNVSSDESINGAADEAPNSRKRARLDFNVDPTILINAAISGKMHTQIEQLSNDENGQPSIKFFNYNEETWNKVYEPSGNLMPCFQIHIIADKGFNYSTNDNCFVNQKKNHFQVTGKIETSDPNIPHCFKLDGQLKCIDHFSIGFVGVKSECLTSEVGIRQSTSERKPINYSPVSFRLQNQRVSIVTVQRLHFSETTLNNQRKNLRPNPDQKYFNLIVRIVGHCKDGSAQLLQTFMSERVIVRATNPGSFEPPETVDASWIKNGGVLSTTGPVVIGKSDPRAALTVDGDIYASGRVMCPSDLRLKENITEKEAKEALENLQKLRIVDYFYKPEVAEKWGLSEDQKRRTGVIAQELAAVLPDAVKNIGDYLTVNESRVFYETVLATQELCRLHGDLDQKIDEKVAEISKRLSEYALKKKLMSSVASNLNSEGKSLSASRTTLNSEASAITLTNTKKNRRTNRKKKNISEPPRSKKISHGTVISLVGVMSFCLLAMSALYILDWHNRNYGYHHYKPPATTAVTKEGPGNVVIPLDTYVPFNQPDAPPMVPACPSKHKCREYCCVEYDRDRAEMEISDYDSSMHYDDGFKANTRSDFKMMGFGNGVRITLPEMGMEIDDRYCIEKSCVPRRQVYSLFIPMTRFMPTIALDLQIDVPSSKVINNCGFIPEFDNRKCNENSRSQPEIPYSHRMYDNTYKISAGQFTQSAYRFRVGYSTELCDIEENTFGGFFEEYNLIFYRACNRPNSTAIKE